MKYLRLLALAALAAFLMPAAAQTVLPAGSAGFSVPRTRAESEVVKPSFPDGAFRTICLFSHMAYDDPIVHWGQPGGSHLHTFFGNTGTDYKTTWNTLGTGASTCAGGSLNRTAYWVPSMIDRVTGQPIAPEIAQIYYKTGFGGVDPKTIKTIPERLRMVAGDMHSAGPQSNAGFFCLVTGINSKSIPLDCPVGSELWSKVDFPQCWDGVNLDSDDHKSHMATTDNGHGCPASHPVALPLLTIIAIYRVPPAGARNWGLVSDHYDASLPPGYSMHADVMWRWDKKTQAKWVKNCLNAVADCHDNLLGDGFELY